MKHCAKVSKLIFLDEDEDGDDGVTVILIIISDNAPYQDKIFNLYLPVFY
jgi:hypothetical protein